MEQSVRVIGSEEKPASENTLQEKETFHGVMELQGNSELQGNTELQEKAALLEKVALLTSRLEVTALMNESLRLENQTQALEITQLNKELGLLKGSLRKLNKSFMKLQKSLNSKFGLSALDEEGESAVDFQAESAHSGPESYPKGLMKEISGGKTRIPDNRPYTQGTSAEIPGASSKTRDTSSEIPGTSAEAPGTSTETQGTSAKTPDTSTERQGTSAETQGTCAKTRNTSTETEGTSAETEGTIACDPASLTGNASGGSDNLTDETKTGEVAEMKKSPEMNYSAVNSPRPGKRIPDFEAIADFVKLKGNKRHHKYLENQVVKVKCVGHEKRTAEIVQSAMENFYKLDGLDRQDNKILAFTLLQAVRKEFSGQVHAISVPILMTNVLLYLYRNDKYKVDELMGVFKISRSEVYRITKFFRKKLWLKDFKVRYNDAFYFSESGRQFVDAVMEAIK